MATTYVLGDLHGCARTFDGLLESVSFDPEVDSLWLVGDLVNRGPRSLETLRRVRQLSEDLGPRCQVVLGNHDLHLIARATGITTSKSKDTLDDILKASDRRKLIRWLSRRPFLVHRDDNLLVHAGLDPEWSESTAAELADALAKRFRDGDHRRRLIRRTLEEVPRSWKDCRGREERWTYALSVLTHIRMVDRKNRPQRYNGPPEKAPDSDYQPWFEARKKSSTTFYFGHWAALGARRGKNFRALDSGCVWGGPLTAATLETDDWIQQEHLDGIERIDH